METKEKISYDDLAKRVGDCILNNELQAQLGGEYEFELENGEVDYCYKHDTKEECEAQDDQCDYESVEVYQTYIIDAGGADYLKRKTNEIVYYCEKLELYLWGITHFGTSWTGVFTEIDA